jgi:glycosyltransferase involved in cell wall biosynthesis
VSVGPLYRSAAFLRSPRMPRAATSNPSARRIRVVTVIDILGTQGGAERLAVQIATGLDPERFESTLCASRWPLPPFLADNAEQAREQLADAGVRFLPLGRRGKLDVWVWARLARYLRRERVDVVHSHKFGSNVWGTLTGRLAGVPVVLAHEHTWSYEGEPLRRLLDRELIARGADRFIAVSREDRRRMTSVERIDPSRTMFIPNGVNALAPPNGRDVRAELGIAPGVPVIGTVCVMRPQKALHVLLRAVADLLPRRPALQVLIAGSGPERDSLERLAGELRVADSVRFLGPRADVPNVLRALDVAVSSSDFEGSPLAVMEYMDAARPIVATSVGGVPDLIEPGEHGLLVPRGDHAALARAVDELLDDPERRRSMGERARERRVSEFSVEVLVHRLEDLYVELLAERGRLPQLPGASTPA